MFAYELANILNYNTTLRYMQVQINSVLCGTLEMTIFGELPKNLGNHNCWMLNLVVINIHKLIMALINPLLASNIVLTSFLAMQYVFNTA